MNATRNGKQLVGTDGLPIDLDNNNLVKFEDIGRMKLTSRGYPEPSNPGHLTMAMFGTKDMLPTDPRYTKFKEWHSLYYTNKNGSSSTPKVSNADALKALIVEINSMKLNDDVKATLIQKAEAACDPRISEYTKYLEERGYVVSRK